MPWSATFGEWSDLTLRPISSDAASDRCPRRPPWQQNEEDEEEHGQEADTFDVDVFSNDSVSLGEGENAPASERTERLPFVLLALRPVALDLQTGWASLLESLEPNFGLPRLARRNKAWRRLRRATGVPLGVPVKPCEAVISSQLAE